MAIEKELNFSDGEELIFHLKNMQEKTSWERKTVINDLSFRTNDGLMFVVINGKSYELRECAKESVFERLGMEGEVLKQLSKDVLVKYMSEAAKVRKGFGQVAVVDGKVDAILSDNETGIDYSLIPASRIFEETQQWIWENTEGLRTFKGAWTHSNVYGKWYTDDEIQVLSQSTSTGQKLAITLTTSDIGKGSVCFRASMYVQKSRYEIPLCQEIKIGHRGQTQMSAVYEALNMMQEAVFEGNDLKRLNEIRIKYPKTAYLRVCKKLKLPKKAVYGVFEFSNQSIEQCKTALQIYLSGNFSY